MRKRDKQILDDLYKFRCLSRDDIVDLHFSNLKHPVPTANNVLKRMRLQGHITANTKLMPYVYFADPAPIKTNSQKIPHFLNIVKFYRELKDKPNVFNVEPKYGDKGTVEPDVFMIWRKAPFFVEIQRSVYSAKVFKEKMDRYEAFFHSGTWKNESWQRRDKKIFPYIWIIGETRYEIGHRSFQVFQSRSVREFLEDLKVGS
jgi:hypothetical protein